jgi:hypothetical protein
MNKYLLALSLVLVSAPAFAACSDQQMADKAMAVATKLEALQKSNPKAAEAVATKMMTAQSDPKAMADMAVMCKSYDDTLADIAKAK